MIQNVLKIVEIDQDFSRKQFSEYETVEKQAHNNYLKIKQYVQKKFKIEQEFLNNAEEFSCLKKSEKNKKNKNENDIFIIQNFENTREI